jgi:hypothetical protein
MEGLDLASIAARTAPGQVIHWAGMKNVFLSRIASADLLLFFEKHYYSKMPGGAFRRLRDNAYHVYLHYRHQLGVRAKQRYRKLVARGMRGVPAGS